MGYILCPTCGNLLGSKEIVYEKKMNDLLKKYNLSKENISFDSIDDNIEFEKDRIKLMNELFDKNNYCCSIRIRNTIDLSELIKYDSGTYS